MESSTKISQSIDWGENENGDKRNKVWNFSAYIAAAVIALTAQGCATRMPPYNPCWDAEYTHNLSTTLGKSMEQLRIINDKLRWLRNLDKKGGDSNSEERKKLQGEALSLEVSIKDMKDALSRCKHKASIMSSR